MFQWQQEERSPGSRQIVRLIAPRWPANQLGQLGEPVGVLAGTKVLQKTHWPRQKCCGSSAKVAKQAHKAPLRARSRARRCDSHGAKEGRGKGPRRSEKRQSNLEIGRAQNKGRNFQLEVTSRRLLGFVQLHTPIYLFLLVRFGLHSSRQNPNGFNVATTTMDHNVKPLLDCAFDASKCLS